MAKKKTVSDEVKAIKTAQDDGKLIIGTTQVLKALRKGVELKGIYTSLNCPDTVREDLAIYGKLAGVAITDLNYPNDELGTICKKQFAIAVLAIQ